MRVLMLSSSIPDVAEVRVEVNQRVADYLINRKRREITQLEERYDVQVRIQTGTNVGPSHLTVRCFNKNGVPVKGVELPQ
jgi:ribonuclease E